MFIDVDLAKKALKECADWGIPRVTLSRLGEPLLHPSLIEIIRYAKKVGIRNVSMVCNATLLTEERAREIILSGLDLISFSVDANSKETFEKIRPGSNFDDVVSNIKRFIMIRNNLSQKKPWVEINTCLMKESLGEVPFVIESWRPLVDRIKVWPVAPLPQSNNQLIVDCPNQNGEKKPCEILWTRLVILSNGQATVCCGDREGALSVGDLAKMSIRELWKSERIRLMRKIHFSKKFDDLPLCKQCFLTDKTWFKSEKEMIGKYGKEWKPLGIFPSSFFS